MNGLQSNDQELAKLYTTDSKETNEKPHFLVSRRLKFSPMQFDSVELKNLSCTIIYF